MNHSAEATPPMEAAQANGEKSPSVAVAIPCLNEAASIGSVVQAFREQLPRAVIYVYDNGSTDDSARLAQQAGAVVRSVPLRGKGRVVRALLNELTEDVIVLVDGDSTYSPSDVHRLLDPILSGKADMAVGNRLARPETGAISALHNAGNRIITGMVNLLFGSHFQDILSGFRVLNRHLVESVATLTNGFEIETELTVRAMTEELRITEVPISYHPRPVGSQSKLRTFQDGYRILLTAGMLMRDYHPLRLFGFVGLLGLVFAALAGGASLAAAARGPHSLRAILGGLSVAFGLSAWIAICTGLILNAINTRARESLQLQRRHRKTHEQ